jgi:1,4-alpha-glucan branching enzyme
MSHVFFGSGINVTDEPSQLIHSINQPNHGFDHSITLHMGGLTTVYLQKVNDE